jgi:outer membrane protein assembly factor BamB
MAIAKDSTAYLLDRDHLGGMGGELASAEATTSQFVSAAAVYRTAQGIYVVNRGPGANCPSGQSGNLFALRIANDGGNWSIKTAWCADQHGKGVPIVSTTDGAADTIVWAVGAEDDNRLHAFDADTGDEILTGDCGGDTPATVHRFTAPIVAKGRIFVAADGHVYAFKP